MSDDMTTKYQQHYNQILTGTLTDSIMKSISYQANIKLANDIIAEQEKTISELTEKNESIGEELSQLKNDKLISHNEQIIELQKKIDDEMKNSVKLASELAELRMIRNQYENVKNQINHLETFKNELSKSREEIENVKTDYEKIISDLKQKIEYLQLTPAKRKKIDELNSKSENTLLSSVDTIKDGGSF